MNYGEKFEPTHCKASREKMLVEADKVAKAEFQHNIQKMEESDDEGMLVDD